METTGPKHIKVDLFESIATSTLRSNSPLPVIDSSTASTPISSATSSRLVSPGHTRPSSPLHHIHSHAHAPHDHHLGIGLESEIAITSSDAAATLTPTSLPPGSPVALGKMLQQMGSTSALTAPSLHSHHESDQYVDPKYTLSNIRKESHMTMHYHHKHHKKKGCYV